MDNAASIKMQSMYWHAPHNAMSYIRYTYICNNDTTHLSLSFQQA